MSENKVLKALHIASTGYSDGTEEEDIFISAITVAEAQEAVIEAANQIRAAHALVNFNLTVGEGPAPTCSCSVCASLRHLDEVKGK